MASVSMSERLGNMNRSVFFVFTVFAFMFVGVVFGVIAALIVGTMIDDGYGRDELIIASLFAPAGVATGAGIVVGTLAALFYRPVPPTHDPLGKPPAR